MTQRLKARAARRRPSCLLVPVALSALAFLAAAGGRAAASPLPPEDLRVRDGGDAWRPDNGFGLLWENPEQPGTPPIVAVRYRVRDPIGTVVVGEKRIGWAAHLISNLYVPNMPAAYTAEVWLEDANGSQGAPASAKLRFDNARPGNVEPQPKPGWVSRTDQPYPLRISRPGEPPPASGIRGYAVSIERASSGDPCQAIDRCSDAETDLRGGSEGDTLSIGELAEGAHYVHAVAVSGSGMKSALPGHAALRVDKTDPVTSLSGLPSGWTNQSVFLVAEAADALSGMKAGAEGESPFTAIRVDGAVPTTAAGDSVNAAVIEAGIHTVAYYARDAAGNVNDGGTSNGQPNRAPATAVVRIDREAPRVAFSNFQDPGHPEVIEARVADSPAGPDGSRGTIAVRPLGSDDRFESLPTEAGEVLRARWDSDAHPPGEYEFRAIGYDAAGNSSSTTQRADGSSMALSNPLKIPTALYSGFGGRTMPAPRCERQKGGTRCRRRTSGEFEQRPGVLAVPHGQGALFSGRLVGARVPVPGERVLVIQRFPTALGPAELVTTVRTGPDGTFTAQLPPGPSREVRAVFAGSPTLTRSTSKAVQLEVGSGVRLRVSSPLATVGGRPVVFGGRLRASGAAISVKERTVQLQFRAPGIPWTEFRSIQTDARGRFRCAYRFSDDDSRGVRFQFRAFVPTQVGWPYRPAGSAPVTVRGR